MLLYYKSGGGDIMFKEMPYGRDVYVTNMAGIRKLFYMRRVVKYPRCQKSGKISCLWGCGRGYEDIVDEYCWFWQVGNGKDIRFSEDNWCGDDYLKGKYPRLFLISMSKKASVKEMT